MATVLPEGKQSFTNALGVPLVGGRVYTFLTATNTPKVTYQDAAGTIPNANPVILDARGEATIFWDGVYKVELRDALNNLIWVVDGIATAEPAGTAAQILVQLLLATGSALIGWMQDGVGAVYRLVQDKLREQVSVLDFGATNDGTGDTTAAVLKAEALLGARGGTILFPRGRYRLGSSIVEKPYIVYRGVGINGTEVFADGDFPVFDRQGAEAVTINGGGVQCMTVRGGWTGNPLTRQNSIGIRCFGSNGSIYRDLRIHSAFLGFQFAYNYESSCDNIFVMGGGSDQSYIGYYGEPATAINVNNAMFMTKCVAFNTVSHGWRIWNPNGSVFTGVTAEACGGYGFSIGSGVVQPIPAQFFNMINCLGDSCTAANFAIFGALTQPATRMLFANNWSGLTFTGSNWEFQNATEIMFTGNNGISAAQCAVRLTNAPINITGFVGNNYNISNAGFAGISLANTTGAIVMGCEVFTGFTGLGGRGVDESGTSDGNIIIGNQILTGAQILGPNTIVKGNRGFRTEAAGSVIVTAGNTGGTIAHTLGMTPNYGEIMAITNSPGVAVAVNNLTATTFDLEIEVQPGDVGIGWQAIITRG